MILTIVVVLWDALFVLLRPRSLPGNDLAIFFYPYKLYIEVDKAYGNMDDAFTKAQSWLNVAEIVISVAAVLLLFLRKPSGLLLALVVNTMTFWKTVLYQLQYTPLCKSAHCNLDHTTWTDAVLLFIVPNGVWLVFPFLCMCHYFNVLWSLVTRGIESQSHNKDK